MAGFYALGRATTPQLSAVLGTGRGDVGPAALGRQRRHAEVVRQGKAGAVARRQARVAGTSSISTAAV